jgi:ParB family transcriptional regulator, chromosome partitioning protein
VNQPKKSGLGKGLGALLGTAAVQEQRSQHNNQSGNAEKIAAINANSLGTLRDIPVAQIRPNPGQPRSTFNLEAIAELAESIQVQGLIQPITVRETSSGFELIAGERRWRATKVLGNTLIAAYVRSATDSQMLELGLIENIQREDLNPAEIARSYQRMISELGYKQEDLAGRVGKNRATVTNYLRLLKLPPTLVDALENGSLSMGHAKALLGLERTEDQLGAAKLVAEKSLSVRATEELVKGWHVQPKAGGKEPEVAKNVEMESVVDALRSKFGVHIQAASRKNGAGELRFSYASMDELNRILELLF